MPRLMKLEAAAHYLGMSPTSFRKTVQPNVPRFKVLDLDNTREHGKIYHYDRIDLDRWADELREKQLAESANQPDHSADGERTNAQKGVIPWPASKSRGCNGAATPGTSTRESRGTADFQRALALTTGKKRKSI